MNNTLTIILMIIVALMMIKNYGAMKRAGQNREYIDCYKAIMDKEEDAYERINNYINSTNDEEFKNKARIFKLFYDLDNNSYEEELNNLNLHDLYYTKDKVDLRKIEFNSETALWIINLMAKANKTGHKDAIEKLYEKCKENENILGSYVEYNLIKSAHDIFTGNKEGNEFPKNLLIGEYDGYRYDKQTIGVSKRIAGCLLAYNNEDILDFDEDLKAFLGTKFGKNFMENLGIADRFKEEVEEETQEETVEENNEEA